MPGNCRQEHPGSSVAVRPGTRLGVSASRLPCRQEAGAASASVSSRRYRPEAPPLRVEETLAASQTWLLPMLLPVGRALTSQPRSPTVLATAESLEAPPIRAVLGKYGLRFPS